MRSGYMTGAAVSARRRSTRQARVQNSADAATQSLSFADRQIVEFAKVLAIEERTRHEPIILLDEPTSVLEAEEIDRISR